MNPTEHPACLRSALWVSSRREGALCAPVSPQGGTGYQGVKIRSPRTGIFATHCALLRRQGAAAPWLPNVYPTTINQARLVAGHAPRDPRVRRSGGVGSQMQPADRGASAPSQTIDGPESRLVAATASGPSSVLAAAPTATAANPGHVPPAAPVPATAPPSQDAAGTPSRINEPRRHRRPRPFWEFVWIRVSPMQSLASRIRRGARISGSGGSEAGMAPAEPDAQARAIASPRARVGVQRRAAEAWDRASYGLCTPRRFVLLLVVSVFAASLGVLLTSAPASAIKQYVPATPASFGESGTGAGQVAAPEGVAVNDATGDVYVVDTGNARIDEWNATGETFIRAWGWGVADGVTEAPQSCSLICFKGFSGSGAGEFQTPTRVAVDNSKSASAGDVYVVDPGAGRISKFSAEGVFLGQLTGRCEEPGDTPPLCPNSGFVPFGLLNGAAVDPSGNVWVEESADPISFGTLDEFTATGGFVTAVGTRTEGDRGGVAVDSAGGIYITGAGGVVDKVRSATGETVSEFDQGITALAVNAATDNLLLDKESQLELFGAFGEPSSAASQTFATAGLAESFGVAVNGASGTAYATQQGASNVESFDFVSFPDLQTTDVTEAAVTFHGSFDPEGEVVTACTFEYGTASPSEHAEPCEQEPKDITGTGAVPLSRTVTGLQPRTTYHMRLTMVLAGQTRSSGESTFFTSTKPLVEAESAPSVALTEAVVSASIDASGLPTSYHVEYGTTESYGSTTADVDLGAQQQTTAVRVRLSGLKPETEYHYVFTATNELGTTVSEEKATFTTPPAGGPSVSTLPDQRAYELVSPATSGEAQVFPPFDGTSATKQFQTLRLVRAAAGGGSVAYVANSPASGGTGENGNGQGDEWLATRAPSGWTATDAQPSQEFFAKEPRNHEALYASFASDLSAGFLTAPGQLTGEVPEQCLDLYSRATANGVYTPAITGNQNAGNCGAPVLAGSTTDNSQLFFEDGAALTQGTLSLGGEEENLYVAAAGRLSPVSVLPSGAPAGNAKFGSQVEYSPEGGANFIHVISNDGSRVFWTDLNTEVTAENPTGATRLFVREDAASESARTVLVAEDGEYLTASSDGVTVFFAKQGDLYAFDVNTHQTTDLAENGEVQGVVSSSEDGSYVYFVADASLAAGASAGSPNLYLRRRVGTTWAPPTFVATLSPLDNEFDSGVHLFGFGDWKPTARLRTAEATPDGHELVFMSALRLPGSAYNSPGCEPAEHNCTPEVFVYDAATARITCASCNPGGQPAEPYNGSAEPQALGSFLPVSHSNAYMLRWINEAGSKVFFDTTEPLVPEDTNHAQDVYEWEREGAGTCPSGRASGCISLISGNLSSEESFLIDASANGEDVFFTTRGQLVPQDRNDKVDLYDARVNGGFPETSLACTGTGCQGVPPSPPSFATPSSATFGGAGNFPPPPATKPKTAAQIRSEKLARALKACRKKHDRHKRTACQRRARRRYGPARNARKADAHFKGKAGSKS